MDTTTRDCKICGREMDSIYAIDEGICDECREVNKSIKEKFIDILFDEGIIKNKNIVPKGILPQDRCGCCWCNDCNHIKDECVCSDNRLLYKIYSLKI